MKKIVLVGLGLFLPLFAFGQGQPSGKTLAATMDVFVFPTEGQEASQQSQDEAAADLENFKKAFSVCLEAKDYMVKF